jgi:hypothetical protein
MTKLESSLQAGRIISGVQGFGEGTPNGDWTVQGGTETMRIIRFLLVTMIASGVAVTPNAWSGEVDQVEYIVSSQIVSDEVAGGGSCANGACGSGGEMVSDSMEYGGMAGSGSIGGVGGGEIRGRLASAASYIGDIARGGAANTDVGCVPRTYGHPDLFYNFYTQGNCNATNAQMYISPVPVPPNVGHTFYTYQPFMPHEMLYWHSDRYHNYYDGGRGMNHTKVHYFAPPVRQAASNFYWNHLRIPR